MDEIKKITKQNLLDNIIIIIKSISLIDLYNEVLETGKCDKEKLKAIGSAYYYYILVKNIEMKSLPQLGAILGRLDAREDVGEITKAQYLYFIHYINQIDVRIEEVDKDNNLYL